MSKLRQTLRQTSTVPTEPAATECQPIEPEPAEEIPYIEVGPRHSLEGSPDVLAAAAPEGRAAGFIPAVRTAGIRPAARPEPVPEAAPAFQPSSLPRPHNVLFRSLAPKSRFAPELVAFHAPASPAGARYAELLESLMGAVMDKGGAGPTALLLLGTRSEAGTTTVLLNVAITAARQGLRVAVIDANLRRPAVAARLGLAPAPGLTEVLAEERSVAQTLRTTEQANLSALTAGSPTPTLATTEAIRWLLNELRGRFDLVLVDGPRWDGRAAAVALAGAADAVFLVVPSNEADSSPAKDLIRTLPEQGVRLAGCILTGD
jgi:Mrp family chromosome partitioning ATPase